MFNQKLTSALHHARPLVPVFVFIALLFINGICEANSPDRSATMKATNVTRTEQIFEVNPNFVAGDAQILFLQFTGDLLNPMPWDYELAISDRGGYNRSSLTAPGVVDYVVMPGGQEVRYVLAGPSVAPEDAAGAGADLEWVELWQLNLRDGTSQRLQRLLAEPVHAAQTLLAVRVQTGAELNRWTSASPHGNGTVTVVRDKEEDRDLVRFYFDHEGSGAPVLSTETYMTHTHFAWMPPVVWLDATNFLTLTFSSETDAAFPQTNGLFSIVWVNSETGEHTVIYKSTRVEPFPRFSLDHDSEALYFQQSDGTAGTELWRLNLRSRKADMIYWTEAAIGEARSSFDGASLVFTQLAADNFDIIRLDLERNRQQRLAGN